MAGVRGLGVCRFGVFELDKSSREVRKSGVRIRLPDQSVEVLLVLLERRGEVVTHEELQNRLWPHGTVVEYEHSIYAAVKRLRDALSDDAGNPRFIETLPAVGYRFIAPLLKTSPERDLPDKPNDLKMVAVPKGAAPAGKVAVEPGTAGEEWITIGRTLSHYQILGKLGEGGMGVVYRARDTHLNRDVAIKALPDLFADDPERKARFEREARLLATLSHPNIAAIHGMEEADGKFYLVLELVEGQTLAERLKKGRIRLDETLDISRQIAAGLEAAHEKGIIHRDLKPANIKLTLEGKIKILDFGLAKAFCEETVAADPSKSPTMTDEMTASGIVLGTAAYMSPEQARGKPADKRADIWAFGCILYECLTGKRVFGGETVTETLAAVIKEEPDWKALPSDAPYNVRAVLRRCLQKDPRLRLHDIADAGIEVEESVAEAAEAVTAPRRVSRRWLVAFGAVGLIAGVLVGAGLMWRFRTVPAASVVRSVIKLEPGYCLDGWRRFRGFLRPTRTAMAISSDGRFIVYSAVPENVGPEAKGQLYLRRMDQAEAKFIPGTEGGISPFLSPDDRWVGFWADGKLMKVSIDGGVPVILCAALLPFGASWGFDNRIVFSPDEGVGLSVVSADGGRPEVLTVPDKTKQEESHRLPNCLPGGDGVLFTVTANAWDLQPGVALLQLKTRQWRHLLDDAADARYVPTGHLVFLRQGSLMAMPFDLGRLEVTGQPVPIIANVMQALNARESELDLAAGQFGISASGWLVYALGGITPELEDSLVWVDQKGTASPAVPFKATFGAPRVAPDGQRVGYNTGLIGYGVWVYDPVRGTASRLISEGKGNNMLWSPDGKRVAFGWWKSGQPNLYWQSADGSSPMERLTTSEYIQFPGAWSPDGSTLAFVECHADRGKGNDIMLLDLRSRRITPFLLNSWPNLAYPEFSPDGRWMAYSSNESGRQEVYVRPFPGPGGKWQISHEGGGQPLWARNGKQVFYRWGDRVWAVDVQTEATMRAGKPRLLFEQPGFGGANPVRDWDLSFDGRRFLMRKVDERKPTPVTEMILVQNWFEELKRLAPKGRK